MTADLATSCLERSAIMSSPLAPKSSQATELCHIHNLQVCAGQKKLLDVPHLQLYAKQLTTFIGPNGAGKSTLLHSLLNCTGHTRLKTTGTINYVMANTDGSPHRNTPHSLISQGKIAWVGQHEQFELPLNVLQYALLGVSPQLAWYQTPNVAQTTKARELLHQFELIHLQDRRVSGLSGGEKQRLAVVRALMQDTQILLLDEPTNHLDIRHQRFLLQYLKELVSTAHKTLLVVLHDLTLAYRYSDHVVLMDKGAVVAHGSPEHVMTQERLSGVYQTPIETYDTPNGRLFVS